MSVLWLVPVFFILALLVPLVWSLGGAYSRSRGPRTIVCPEINEGVTIQLDLRHALKMHVTGDLGGKVKECARWPQRKDCGQGCLKQIGAAA